METLTRQIVSAEGRYKQYHTSREEKEQHLLTRDDWRKVDDPKRIFHRLQSRGLVNVISESMADVTTTPGGAPSVNVLERILDRSDLTDIYYFYKLTALSKAVVRIKVRNPYGGTLWHGTGFLISPRLLMTNNHVLQNKMQARSSLVQFDFYKSDDGTVSTPVEFHLQPELFFRTDSPLDFTIVGIEETNPSARSTLEYGFFSLIPESGKAVVGERVNIIQHPSGRPKEIAFRDNRIIDVPGDFLHYKADTLPGSSGSPVLNEDGDLAALHHAGVPNRDSAGKILLQNGTPWDGSRSTVDDIEWVANEGVRISQILKHLNKAGLPQQELLLLEQCYTAPPSPEKILGGIVDGLCRAKVDSEASLIKPKDGLRTNDSSPITEDNGSVSWFFRVNVGPHEVTQTPKKREQKLPQKNSLQPVTKKNKKPNIGNTNLGIWDPKNYYNEKEDQVARESYYQGVSHNDNKSDFFHTLSNLLQQTHTTTLNYREARLDHLYPNVDRRESGNLRNVYSGGILDPTDVIHAEKAFINEAQLEKFGEGFEFDSDHYESIEAFELMLEEEASYPFNCEHVVPQSWFNKKSIPRADLHHLFTCEPDCNSFRGNFAYFDFPPLEEATRADCGQRAGKNGDDSKFEPEFSHGAVARATLYFLLRYPKEITGDLTEMPTNRLQTLKRWHKAEPVSLYELHRNAEIFRVQGCRNPLIDFPRWVNKIDFLIGLQ